MKIIETHGRELLTTTYEEETELAKLVMDCIAQRWVQGEFQELLHRIFYLKCTRGYLPRIEDIHRLLDFIERYDLPVPDLGSSDEDIWSELSLVKFDTIEEKREEVRRTIIRIWREMWEHHDGIKAVSDYYRNFPGDENREQSHIDVEQYIAEQDQLEEMFWTEVERVMKEYECNRHNAVLLVSDYIPRGNYDFIENQQDEDEDEEPKWIIPGT